MSWWCEWVQKRLVNPEDERTWPMWVRRHVACCPGCQEYRQRVLRLRTALSGVPSPEMPDFLPQRTMGVIRLWVAQGIETAPSEGLSVWAWRAVWVGIFLLFFALWRHEVPQLSPPVASPVVHTTPAHYGAETGRVPRSVAASEEIPWMVLVPRPAEWVGPRFVIDPFEVTATQHPEGLQVGGVSVTPVSFEY